jgi:hypothetical protein
MSIYPNQAGEHLVEPSRKVTIMKPTTAAVVLALTCLLAKPSISEARYQDGMSLYEYVRSSPPSCTDPSGLWGTDVHIDLTEKLAEWAGIACPEKMAGFANKPDEGDKDPPKAFAKAAELRAMAALITESPLMIETPFQEAKRQKEREDMLDEASRILQEVREMHFPVSENGLVEPGSDAARRRALGGMQEGRCDFEMFSTGLHVFEDSWSHQGKPFLSGMGHGRGAVMEPGEDLTALGINADMDTMNAIRTRAMAAGTSIRGIPGPWLKLTGLAAATSTSADDVTVWPKDVREMALDVYRMMKDFKKNCPCSCPGGVGKGRKTSYADPKPEAWVQEQLGRDYPGDNKVK